MNVSLFKLIIAAGICLSSSVDVHAFVSTHSTLISRFKVMSCFPSIDMEFMVINWLCVFFSSVATWNQCPISSEDDKTSLLISKSSSCYKSCCDLPSIVSRVSTDGIHILFICLPGSTAEQTLPIIHSDLQSMSKIRRNLAKNKHRNNKYKPRTSVWCLLELKDQQYNYGCTCGMSC